MFDKITGDPLIFSHALGATIALIASLIVIFSRKGTRFHMGIGRVFVWSMLISCVSGFFIFDLTGRPTLFHVLSGIEIISVLIGWFAMVRHRATGSRAWLMSHYFNMAFAALGLWLALVAQFALNSSWGFRLLQINSMDEYWRVFAVLIGVLYIAGGAYIFTLGRRAARRYAEASVGFANPGGA